jgi:hypothetical protein
MVVLSMFRVSATISGGEWVNQSDKMQIRTRAKVKIGSLQQLCLLPRSRAQTWANSWIRCSLFKRIFFLGVEANGVTSPMVRAGLPAARPLCR